MKTNSLKKACNLIGGTKLAELLSKSIGSVHRQTIYKFIAKGYAPADWFHVIVEATEGQVTYDELYADLYTNKRDCNPQDVTNQIEKFTSVCKKKTTDVRNSAHGDAA